MAVQYCNYDIKGTLAVTGTSALAGTVTITESTVNPLLNIYNTSNGSGATIRFSDTAAQSQVGNLTFYHADSASQGGGASFHFASEPDTVLVVGSSSVNGRFVAKSAGSVGEVDYGFYDDVNTGMVRTSADNVSLVAGGVAGVGVGSTAVSLKYAGTTKLTTLNTGVQIAGDGTFSGDIYASSSSSTIGTPRIIMQSDGTLDWGQAYDYGTLTWNTGYALMYGQSGKGIKFATNGSTTALTLDTSQNATFAGDITVSGGDITLGGTGRITGVDTVSAGTDAANKDYVDTAVSGISSGVTSIATTNGITGGTITSTGTIQVDSTVVRTTGAQTIGGVKSFSTYIGMQEDHYVNYSFEMIDNATPQYILLCRNTSNNDINGVIRMDRTSGNWQSASVEVIVSAGSGAMYGGTLRTLQVTQSSEDYRLISCTYNSISYIAIKYSGNSYPETSGAYFTGRAKISAGTLFQVVSSGVSNEASFGGTTESYNEVDSFVISGDATISGGDITLGGTGRIQGVDTVSASTDAANKTYVDNAISGVPQGTVTGSGQNLRLALWDGSSSIGSDGDFTYNGDTIFTTKLSVQNQINTNSANLEINYANGDGTTTSFKNFDIRDGKNGQVAQFVGSTKQTTLYGNLTIGGSDVFMPGSIFHTGDSNTYFGFHGNDLWRVVTGGSERLEVSNSGLKLGNTGATVSSILDQNDLGSNSDTALATQQSIKAYVDAQIQTIPSGLNFQGNWNASTNSPTLVSGTGTPGFYYNVSVAGSTNLDGETDWQVGDWAVFVEAGVTDKWEKIDNTSALTGVGVSGRVTFWNGTNTLSSDGDFTYNSTTNVLTIGGYDSTGWSDAYNNTITAFSATSGSTTVLTLTQRDGGTITTSFVNPQGTVTGTGTNNRIALWNGTTAIDSDSDFYVDGDTIFTTNLEANGNISVADDINITNAGGVVSFTGSGYIGAADNFYVGGASNGTDHTYIGDNGRNVTIYNGATLTISGALNLQTLSNATTDTNAFLVSDSGEVKYRTGSQLLSDIGGAPATGGSYLPLAAGSGSPLTGDLYLDDGSGASPSIYLKNGSDNYWRLVNGSTGILTLKEGTTDKLTFAAGGNATFAGDITSNGLTVDYTGNRTGDAGILVTNDGSDWGIKVDKDGTTDYGILSQTDGENAIVVRNAAGTTNIQLQGDGDATFAGNVTATNILTVAGAATGSPFLQFTQGGTQKSYIQYVDSGDSFELQSDNQFVVRTGGSTTALTINSSQNATFAGSLDVNGTGNNTFTGNILIDNAAPIIQTNSSNNASGLRINVTGISDSTNNLFRIQRAGTTVLDIRGNSNAIFSGDVTVAGGINVSSPGSSFYTTFKSANDYVIGLKDSANTMQWWLKTYTDGRFALHENGGSDTFTIAAGGNATFAGDLTVSGGDISLGGTGRIQGIDTVSAGTDAANKDYVDTAVAGSGSGTVTSVSSSTTSQLTVSQSSPAPALSIVTAAVTNGGTALATGNQIYDWGVATFAPIVSGGYLPLAGNTTATALTGDVYFANQQQARFLTSSNAVGLRLQTSGTSSFIDNENGDMYIRQEADNNDMIFQADDGSGGNATYFKLDGSARSIVVTADLGVYHNDGIASRFGDAGDLQIYHDGSNSYIKEGGTGELIISSGTVLRLRSDASPTGEEYINCTRDGAVALFYNNVEKFHTSSSGVDVLGDLTVDTTAVIDGATTINGQLNQNGDIKLGASASIILDDTPTGQTTSGSGTIVEWSVSESTTAGTLYVVKTNGGWTTADADSEAKSTAMAAIALGGNATSGMLLQGFFYKASHGFAIGSPLYISNTAGAFSNTRPTGTGDYVRIIGYATSTNYIYFDPDKTWVKID